MKLVHQGKSRWHSYHVLVSTSPFFKETDHGVTSWWLNQPAPLRFARDMKTLVLIGVWGLLLEG